MASVIGTWFDIGECTGSVGDEGNSREKFEIRDLFDDSDRLILIGANRRCGSCRR